MRWKYLFVGILAGCLLISVFLGGRLLIKSRLQSRYRLPDYLVLTAPSATYNLTTASIAARINYDQTTTDFISHLFSRPPVLVLDYDTAALAGQVESLAAALNRPATASQLTVTQKPPAVALKIGQSGTVVDEAALRQSILASLQSLNSTPIIIPLVSVAPAVGPAEAEATFAAARRLLSQKLLLGIDTQTATISGTQLASWLDFNNQFKTADITAYAASLSAAYHQEPVNAVFKFENNRVTDFEPAQSGRTLARDSITSAVSRGLVNLLAGTAPAVTETVPFTPIAPAVKNEDVNNLGIKELLGRGTSTFHHSDSIRNLNIKRGAEVVDRILVAPGEEFSFIKNLGDVSLASGYRMAYIIKDNKTELDVGGGICQVSTTLFRAMLAAGLEITQRQSHAYRVSYYEEDRPPGYDATVFIPNPDLRFINDTGHYLLIQNTFDLPNRTLTYEIYGTSDGRQVTVDNYKQWGATPPPPDQYIDDPTLPTGKIVQTEHRIPGLSVSFDWTVARNGAVVHQKTFKSVYVPWAAVYRRGTGPATSQ